MGGCLSSDPQERTCCDDIYDSEFQCVCCYIDFCCCCKKMVEKRRNEQRERNVNNLSINIHGNHNAPLYTINTLQK